MSSTHRGRSVNPLTPPRNQRASSASPKSPSLLERLALRSNNSNKRSSDGNKKSSSASKKKKKGSIKGSFGLLVSPRSGRRASLRKENDNDMSPNVLQWMERTCPQDVLPKILALAGPQTTAALGKTNRHWKHVVQQEGTWRVLCEELYKWKPGEPEPRSWLEHYRLNPCVPVDYKTVHKALAVALGDDDVDATRSQRKKPDAAQRRSIRILLRPGKYYLEKAITIQAVAGIKVSIETMDMPKNIFRPLPQLQAQHAAAVPEQALVKRNSSFRNLLRRARSGSADRVVEETEHSDTSFDNEDWMDLVVSPQYPKHATLVLRSRRHNEPAICIRQGTLVVKGVEIQHNSHGIDIWNGNAAVQIQPPIVDDMPVPDVVPPTAVLDRVQVTSRSGRGIVNIDGGSVVIRGCAVHDCAATGIYIGGPGSKAIVDRSDVIHNGIGNRSRRGIARGHSGVYLEQGFAKIYDCNISNNTLTGISSVSADNAILELERCDLTANGTYQLEMPEPGSLSRRRSVTRDNYLSVVGPSRLRSGLYGTSSSTSANHRSSSRSYSFNNNNTIDNNNHSRQNANPLLG